MTDTNKTEIKRKAHDFELDDCKLTIEQGFSLNAADEGESQVLENQLHSLTSALQMSERKVDTLKNKPLLGKQLLFELQSLFPQLTACSFSETIVYSSVDSTGIKTALVLLSVPAKSLQLEDKERIGVWLRSRLPQLNSIKVYFEEKLDEKAILKATAKRKRKARA